MYTKKILAVLQRLPQGIHGASAIFFRSLNIYNNCPPQRHLRSFCAWIFTMNSCCASVYDAFTRQCSWELGRSKYYLQLNIYNKGPQKKLRQSQFKFGSSMQSLLGFKSKFLNIIENRKITLKLNKNLYMKVCKVQRQLKTATLFLSLRGFFCKFSGEEKIDDWP